MPRQNSSCLTLEAKISTARTKSSGPITGLISIVRYIGVRYIRVPLYFKTKDHKVIAQLNKLKTVDTFVVNFSYWPALFC